MKEHYSPAWWLVTALFSVLVGGLLSFMLFPHALFWAGMSVLVCGMLWHVSERYQASLVARINAVSTHQVDVQLHDWERVCVPDAQIAAVQQRILLDPRTGVAQFGNLVLTVLKLISLYLKTLPSALFWLIVAMVMFMPHDAAEILTTLSNSTPQEVIHALQVTGGLQGVIGQLLVTVLGFSAVLMMIIGWNPGFRNCWREALNQKLQSYYDYPSSSPFQFSRGDDTPATETPSHGR